ncbi:UNVERIFIED_CONTAM: hypothetical protein FKN15_029236 [Acipenser sinensis]
MWDSPLNAIEGFTPQLDLLQSGTQKSKHPCQQTQPLDQLFYKDWLLAKLLRTLHKNSLNIPVGSDHRATFLLHQCSFLLSAARAASPFTVAAQQPRNTAEAEPIEQIHLNIFVDVKSLIKPIAVSISVISTWLDDMDKRAASNSAVIDILPGPASATFTLAVTPSISALLGPTADVPTYNLASTALKSSHEAPAIRNHTLAPDH